jgi:hypothetical protein
MAMADLLPGLGDTGGWTKRHLLGLEDLSAEEIT